MRAPVTETFKEGFETPTDALHLRDLLQVAGELDSNRKKVVAEFMNCWLDMRENTKPVLKVNHDLKVGMSVYVYTNRSSKLESCWRGPFVISALSTRSAILTTDRGLEEHYIGNLRRCQAPLTESGRPSRYAARQSREKTRAIAMTADREMRVERSVISKRKRTRSLDEETAETFAKTPRV
ncbi:hypothetical protein FOL47_004437 [Perkinsus chesapeaki]|uniref:Uncharacterized protein n=1 Tax=Perkinsus chesapeaki TaxID=330153 RepID=A0A7J6M3K4_PERCH|nr:hypothetical protein FOL47_004437 [Perkinsus chesapeaki]